MNALKEIFNAENEINIIGTRHGEKLFESLISREEMLRSVDEGNFYRIPADNRNLNYSNFVDQGNEDLSEIEDYHSHNTKRLKLNELKSLLLDLPYIQEKLSL